MNRLFRKPANPTKQRNLSGFLLIIFTLYVYDYRVWQTLKQRYICSVPPGKHVYFATRTHTARLCCTFLHRTRHHSAQAMNMSTYTPTPTWAMLYPTLLRKSESHLRWKCPLWRKGGGWGIKRINRPNLAVAHRPLSKRYEQNHMNLLLIMYLVNTSHLVL